MSKSIECLRCHTPMQYLNRYQFQLGKTGWLTGDWSNLLAGALELEVYCCPNCGKTELFRPENSGEYQIAQVQCPNCGTMHDIDDPKCPFCKYREN